jgi:hypothetical protein
MTLSTLPSPPCTQCSAVFALENTYTTLLDFGGINSGDAEGAIKRADKGGMVSAKQLRGLVTLLEGVWGGMRGGGCWQGAVQML